MSPRANRRRRDSDSQDSAPPGGPLGPEQTESWPDGDWVVRQVTGAAATKTYRCPGCDHEIRPATPHVVAWPADEAGLDRRRHWHRACWRARDRRAARLRRSPGPPY